MLSARHQATAPLGTGAHGGGGNTVRGEAHYYHEGSTISASPVKRLVLSPVDDQTVVAVVRRKKGKSAAT